MFDSVIVTVVVVILWLLLVLVVYDEYVKSKPQREREQHLINQWLLHNRWRWPPIEGWQVGYNCARSPVPYWALQESPIVWRPRRRWILQDIQENWIQDGDGLKRK